MSPWISGGRKYSTIWNSAARGKGCAAAAEPSLFENEAELLDIVGDLKKPKGCAAAAGPRP